MDKGAVMKSDDLEFLLHELSEFDHSAEGWGHDLRLDLADLVLAEMNRHKWTQTTLAKRAGVKPSFVNRIIHAGANCTFDSAAKLLFALGVKPRLARASRLEASTNSHLYCWPDQNQTTKVKIDESEPEKVNFHHSSEPSATQFCQVGSS